MTIAVVATSTAAADRYRTDEDLLLVIPAINGILANDKAINPAAGLTAVLVDAPVHGTLVTFGGDGGFTYPPDPDFNGKDSFTYVAVDGGAGLKPLDKPMLEGAVKGPLNNNTGGALTRSDAGVFTPAPSPGTRGAGELTYRVSYNGSASNLATVSLRVDPVNDSPVAVGDIYNTGVNTLLAVNAVTGVLQNDDDVDLDSLQALLEDDVTDGVLTLNTDGSFSYTPDLDFTGTDGFTYRASDGVLDALASVTISVSGGGGNNTPPRFVTGGTGASCRGRSSAAASTRPTPWSRRTSTVTAISTPPRRISSMIRSSGTSTTATAATPSGPWMRPSMAPTR